MRCCSEIQKPSVQEDRYGSSPPGQRKEPLAALHLHARKKGVWLDPRIGSAGDGHVSCTRCMLRAAAAVHRGVLLCLLLLVFGILAGCLSPFQKRQRRRAVKFRKVACIFTCKGGTRSALNRDSLSSATLTASIYILIRTILNLFFLVPTIQM